MNRILRTLIASLYAAHLIVNPISLVKAADDTATLNDIRIEGDNVVLDLSQLMPYDIFTLSSPWRLVIEMPETEYKASFSRKNVKAPIVSRIRGYQFKENPLIARVVLDLNGPVDYNATAGNSTDYRGS